MAVAVVSLPVVTLGSKIARCRPCFKSSTMTSETLGIRSTVLPEYDTSVSAKTNFGFICLYLSRIPYTPKTKSLVSNHCRVGIRENHIPCCPCLWQFQSI